MNWVYNQRVDSGPSLGSLQFSGALQSYKLERGEHVVNPDEICIKADHIKFMQTSGLERIIHLTNAPNWPCPGAEMKLCE
jgi:hypothetical protein